MLILQHKLCKRWSSLCDCTPDSTVYETLHNTEKPVFFFNYIGINLFLSTTPGIFDKQSYLNNCSIIHIISPIHCLWILLFFCECNMCTYCKLNLFCFWLFWDHFVCIGFYKAIECSIMCLHIAGICFLFFWYINIKYSLYVNCTICLY